MNSIHNAKPVSEAPNAATSSISASEGQETMKTFTLARKRFLAEDCIGGVLVNPKLPENFESTSNEWRPASHQKWWGRPFIVTESVDELDRYYAERNDKWAAEGQRYWETEGRQKWTEAWPSGIRYEVRCLDGGAWDRATSWGMFATLEEALVCARGGIPWDRRSKKGEDA